jgi:hypothetical protein
MAQYKVIAGTFHVKGFQPDGDSIRFQANKPEHWNFFKWGSEAEKNAKRKQLRIEAIDAMETHYEGWHQPRPFALAELEALLELLNITEVIYSLSVTQIVDANDGKVGYIASASTDRFGRPVSYVFPKSTRLTDGAVLDSATLPVEKSVNFLLAREGLAYPTFYTTTDHTLAEVRNQADRQTKSPEASSLRDFYIPFPSDYYSSFLASISFLCVSMI